MSIDITNATYGRATYGVYHYTARLPAYVDEYSALIVGNVTAVDDLHVVSEELTAAQVSAIFTSGVPQQRGATTILLAPFDGNLEAGDMGVGGLPIESWQLTRDSEIIATYPNQPESTTFTFDDHTVPAQQPAVYTVAPVATNGVVGDAVHKQVTPQFDGWWLVDPNAPDKINVQFLWNTAAGSIATDEARAEIRTFADKPFVRYGQFYAERGTLGGSFDTREQYEALRGAIRKRRRLLLKNWRGDAWWVNVFAPQRTPGIAEEYVMVEWVEVGGDSA